MRILIGDGRSDFCAAETADLVVAKGALAEHCQTNGLAYIVFGNFAGATTLLADWIGACDASTAGALPKGPRSMRPPLRLAATGKSAIPRRHLDDAELLKLEAIYCSHGDTVHYSEPPKIFERCEGSYLYDADGTPYPRSADVVLGGQLRLRATAASTTR